MVEVAAEGMATTAGTTDETTRTTGGTVEVLHRRPAKTLKRESTSFSALALLPLTLRPFQDPCPQLLRQADCSSHSPTRLHSRRSSFSP